MSDDARFLFLVCFIVYDCQGYGLWGGESCFDYPLRVLFGLEVVNLELCCCGHETSGGCFNCLAGGEHK